LIRFSNLAGDCFANTARNDIRNRIVMHQDKMLLWW
jgi:hypothetical protein